MIWVYQAQQSCVGSQRSFGISSSKLQVKVEVKNLDDWVEMSSCSERNRLSKQNQTWFKEQTKSNLIWESIDRRLTWGVGAWTSQGLWVLADPIRCSFQEMQEIEILWISALPFSYFEMSTFSWWASRGWVTCSGSRGWGAPREVAACSCRCLALLTSINDLTQGTQILGLLPKIPYIFLTFWSWQFFLTILIYCCRNW